MSPGFSTTGGPTPLPRRTIPFPSSTPTRPGKRAIEAHLIPVRPEGGGIPEKGFRILPGKIPVLGSPLVSIIIPNKDEKDTLKACLDSIFDRSSYRNFEIIIVENNSKSEEIFQYYEEIDGRNGIRVVYWDKGL